MAVLDTHAIARSLTDAGIKSEHADAIVDAVRQAAGTPADMATKADLAELEARLTWRFAGAMLAQTGVILAAVIGAAIAILRMLGVGVQRPPTNAQAHRTDTGPASHGHGPP